MYRFLIFSFMGLLFSACSTSQNNTIKSDEITIPEINLLEVEYYSESEIDNNILPKALMSDLRSKVDYPTEARKKGLEGRVEVEALITPDGKAYITNLKRRVHPMLDNQVINAIKTTTFKPGILNGEPVNVLTSIPIIFKLPRNPMRKF